MAKIGGFLFLVLVSLSLAACPAGTIYESTYNKCYKYFARATNFLSAEKACQNIGGNLVAVQNAYENSYISGIASASSSSANFWIGANLLMSTQWSFTSGYGTYTNFAPGQPSDPSIYQCAAVRDADNRWTKELCSTQKPYMCQIDPNAIPVGNGCSTPSYPVTTAYPTTTALPSSCSSSYCSAGYTLNTIACKCYKFYPGTTTTYYQSASVCQQDGGTMAIIRNAAENDWLSSFSRNYSTAETNPWIGLYCNSSSIATCQWQDGSSLTYSNFAGSPVYNEPVYLDEINQLWYSFTSSSPGTFICETSSMIRFGDADFQTRPRTRINSARPNKAAERHEKKH